MSWPVPGHTLFNLSRLSHLAFFFHFLRPLHFLRLHIPRWPAVMESSSQISFPDLIHYAILGHAISKRGSRINDERK